MPNSVRTICVISATDSTKGMAPLRKKIEQAGYTLEHRVLEEAITSDWITKELPVTTKGVLFCDANPTEVVSFCEKLRTSSFRFVPVYYAFSTAQKLAKWDDVSPSGVSDIFPTSDPASRIRLRFEMRELELAERAGAHRVSQEQSTQLAKVDTTLKQREEFLSVCAHDLRSPLGLIQTCLSMVIKADKATRQLGTAHTDLLERALRQSGHALSLVKDLLDVMALEQGLKPMYQLIRLHELVNEFYIDYGLQAEQKNIKFHYSNPIPEWKVLADSERIRQLLQNLFTNALKFTEPGKNIYLNVAPFQGRRKGDPPHPMIVISLKDEGKGIPEREMQKIFDRFTQIKEQSREGGRGLGLTVAKQISTLHDGNIWVESEEGKGSTFFVLFPHAISRLICPPKVAEPRRVLVAEPNLEKRKQVYSRLTDWGYSVEFANDGVDAVTLLFHHWPDVLVVTPNLSKIKTGEVTNLLKAEPRLNEIPILLVAPPEAAGAKVAETTLVDAVLSPTFTKEEFQSAIAGYRKGRLRVA